MTIQQLTQKIVEAVQFTEGQKIVHPTWGEGVVFKVMGTLVSATFPGVGNKLVHDTSKLVQVQAKAKVVAKKPQAKLNAELISAKQQLLALGVLEASILIESGTIQVLGADTQEVNGKTFYWDAKVFPFDEDNGNVKINPNQVRNSQAKAYENYKDSQGNKPCKSFQKWLEPQLANLPQIETVVNKIDAKPASIWIREGLHSWELVVSRDSRHVQELSAAIRHELRGLDFQDKKTMVYLSSCESIALCKREEWTTKNKAIAIRKEGKRSILCISEEHFAPILAKIEAAASKCGDSFQMPFGLDYKQ
ncbi:hypothetical protein Cl131_gp142 [Aphanizomenon phage vB_AphaS-CL131]|nr:hypothetical protein Cl131_gp142 [Aphanizomenon phage vB_AphaS-CL131]